MSFRVNPINLCKIDWILRRYSLNSKMRLFNGLSSQLDVFSITKETVLAEKIYPHGMGQVHETGYLALRSIIAGEREGLLFDEFKEVEFNEIANLYRGYFPPIDGTGLHVGMFAIRILHQQFLYQVSEIHSIDRYNSIFMFHNNKYDVKDKFLRLFGYEYKEYIKFTIMLSAYFHKNHVMCIDDLFNNIEVKKTFNKEQLEIMINNLSVSREYFTKVYNDNKSNEIKMLVYNFNPLEMYPIIQEKNYLYCPIPYLLYKGITQGFFHRMCDEYGKTFKEKFGYVFEEYLYMLLKEREETGEYQIIREFKYYKNNSEAKSPDFILENKESLIFIEVKSNSPTIKLRHTNDDVYEKQIMQAYGTGLIQCIKKEKDYHNGIMKNDKLRNKICNIAYIIITFEEFYIPKSGNVLQIIANNSKDINVLEAIKNKKIVFLSLKSLDDFFEHDDRTIFQFLDKIGKNIGFIFGNENINYKYENTKSRRLLGNVFMEIRETKSHR